VEHVFIFYLKIPQLHLIFRRIWCLCSSNFPISHCYMQ